MIKDALKYIISMSAPSIREIGGEMYSDKPLNRICHNPKASAITMTTLKSFVDYIKSGTDIMDEAMIIHVISPIQVELYSQLDMDREREYIAIVQADSPSFSMGKFIHHEDFIIGLQSCFVQNSDSELVLKFAGTVESGTVSSYGDDGITQKATIKTGIASQSTAIVPNPVKLKPYRTFTEVEQPESNFIFRMKDDNGVRCALFEADCGAWKLEAMKNIKEYLEKELKEIERFTVIA